MTQSGSWHETASNVEAWERTPLPGWPHKELLYETTDNGRIAIITMNRPSVHNAVNPAIKSLNYLNNILAKIEANTAGYEEAIMLNAEGYVAECTGDNIFILKDGQMFTPPLSSGALHGITRGTAIDLVAGLGISTAEPNMTRYDLYNADECFLTGTGAEIVPVVKIDQRVIGNGKPGPVTKKVVKAYQELTKVSGEPIAKR